MAFRFETANERWKAYKQSIMEHPFHTPSEGMGTYYGPDFWRDQEIPLDDRTPAVLFNRDGAEFKEGQDFIYGPNKEVLIREPNSYEYPADPNAEWMWIPDYEGLEEYGLFKTRDDARNFGYDSDRGYYVL